MDENNNNIDKGPDEKNGEREWRPNRAGKKRSRPRDRRAGQRSLSRKTKGSSHSQGGGLRALIIDLYERDLLVSYASFCLVTVIALALFITVLVMEQTNVVDEQDIIAKLGTMKQSASAKTKSTQKVEKEKPKDPEVASFAEGYKFKDAAEEIGDDMGSSYIALIDVDKGEVIAKRDSKTVIPPASMTKILSLLVAVEHLDEKKLKEKYEIPSEVLDYIVENDASSVGFEVGEKVPVKDLLYGLILPSGADAALALCNVVAGGQDKFVEMMNKKCKELDISETAHFTNPVGIYNEDLHCTCEDMAVIMKAALENKLARKVLHAHTYTTAKTDQHPDGISISNLFLRRIEDEELPGEVYGAKTGYVSQSGNCAASYLVTKDGKGHYICVTGNAQGAWNCIYSHRDIYNKYVK